MTAFQVKPATSNRFVRSPTGELPLPELLKSPVSVLAADIESNMQLEQGSPLLRTPRKKLFSKTTNNLLSNSQRPPLVPKEFAKPRHWNRRCITDPSSSLIELSKEFPIVKNYQLKKRPPSESPMKVETHGVALTLKKETIKNNFSRRAKTSSSLNSLGLTSSTISTSSSTNAPILPHFKERQDPINRITTETMLKVLNGDFVQQYDKLFIIDCRFPYEFKGGHIKSATNVNSVQELESVFFNDILHSRALVIFHCEFSKQRAPSMAMHMRNRDRTLNASSYPALYYPDIYVLDGGYKQFFADATSWCEPQAYVQMQHSQFKNECKTQVTRRKKDFRRCFSESWLG